LITEPPTGTDFSLLDASMTTHPPDRICATCGRPFSWRRKWAKDWANVRYCSRSCRGGPGAAGRALEAAITGLLHDRPRGATICPSEAARAVSSEQGDAGDPDGWRSLMEEARRAARRLAHASEVEILQGSRVVDPGDFRGPIRIRRAR
jgi:hypothetical protein